MKVLNSLSESAAFCTQGRLAPVLPGLEVEQIGEVGVPVSAVDARRMIAHASQAPYGRGEETTVETDVRCVWQLETSQFSLSNAQWEPFVSGIVDAVKGEFGISQEVQAQLYKLLIYAPGSFFAPHRDLEKTAGMWTGAEWTFCFGRPNSLTIRRFWH